MKLLEFTRIFKGKFFLSGITGIGIFAMISLFTGIFSDINESSGNSIHGINFKKHVLSLDFISEGVATGDINNDGNIDIIAGSYWFEAPGWEKHEISEPKVFDPNTEYSNSMQNFTLDVNNDGWLDVIRVEFPGKPARWFENPKGRDKHWQSHIISQSVCNESPIQVDIDGDGRLDLLFPECDSGPGRMYWWKAPVNSNDTDWQRFPISKNNAPGTETYSHGLGWSDMDGDGKEDVIIAKGWWKTPSNPETSEWEFIEADLGGKAAQMHSYDFDEDGDVDVLGSSPHDYGIWWYEQKQSGQGEKVWKQHLISDHFSQTHALAFTDMDGDGDPDFVTGKRYYAHNSKDPGGKETPVLYWFEFSRDKNNEPVWTPHLIDNDSGVGVEMEVMDITGNQKKDIIIANKKGVFLFEQMD